VAYSKLAHTLSLSSTQRQNFKVVQCILSLIYIKCTHIGLSIFVSPHVPSVWTRFHEIWYWSDLQANRNSRLSVHSSRCLVADSIPSRLPVLLLDHIPCNSLTEHSHILTLLTYSKFGVCSFTAKMEASYPPKCRCPSKTTRC
jgi:hypothetical protein